MTHTLLLADDSVTIQRVIELTFAEEDIRVITVGDGQAAIDRLESNPPDIVLADVDMPKRDGYEVATYVKNRPKLAHIPVVLLTGAFEPIDQARAEAAGSSDVLAKPFEPQMVINRVKQLLGRKKVQELEVPSPESFAPPEGAETVPPVQAPPPLKAPSAPRPPARSSMAMNDEHATNEDQPARTEPGQGTQQPVSLDDYFDQLDAAFSNLGQPGAGTGQHEKTQSEEDWIDSQDDDLRPAAQEPPVASMSGTSDWIDQAPEALAPPPAPPVPQARPLVPPASARPAEPAFTAPPVPQQPVAPMPPSPPPVAFTPPPRPIAPPVPVPPAPVAVAPVITDEVIEQVVARVLQHLSDKVVRETVTGIVASIAERLVTEIASKAVHDIASRTVSEVVAATAQRMVSEVVSAAVEREVIEVVPAIAERMVTETVSTTAERLVQEEIARIKAEE